MGGLVLDALTIVYSQHKVERDFAKLSHILYEVSVSILFCVEMDWK